MILPYTSCSLKIDDTVIYDYANRKEVEAIVRLHYEDVYDHESEFDYNLLDQIHLRHANKIQNDHLNIYILENFVTLNENNYILLCIFIKRCDNIINNLDYRISDYFGIENELSNFLTTKIYYSEN